MHEQSEPVAVAAIRAALSAGELKTMAAIEGVAYALGILVMSQSEKGDGDDPSSDAFEEKMAHLCAHAVELVRARHAEMGPGRLLEVIDGGKPGKPDVARRWKSRSKKRR